MKEIALAKKLWRNDKDQEAINTLIKLDLETNGKANMLIGEIYIGAEKGISNIKRDIRTGKKYLEKAHELGIAEAGLEIGNLYFFGNGVKQNYRLAEKYWKKSFELGSEIAAFELANLYYDYQLPKMIKETIKLYEWLISKNEFVGNSCFKLSKIYAIGIGIPIDQTRSFEFLEKGAASNDVNCCMELALKYYRGYSIYAPNIEKALEVAKRVSNNDLFHKEVAIIIEKMKKGEKL